MSLKNLTEEEFNDLYKSVVKEKEDRKWREYIIKPVRGYGVKVQHKPGVIIRLSLNFCESEIEPAEFKKFSDWLNEPATS